MNLKMIFDCKKMNCVNPLCEIVNKWQSTIIMATLEQVIQKVNELNGPIEFVRMDPSYREYPH